MEKVRLIKRANMIGCQICYEAKCDDACDKLDPSHLLRSIWFYNEQCAAASLDKNYCLNCDAPCMKACVSKQKVDIKGLITRLHDEVKPLLDIGIPEDENKLKTDICGIEIDNPFLLSSSVVSSNYDMCDRAFEAGWTGVAFKTICSFDIHETSPRFSAIRGDDGGIVGFKNIEQLSDHSVAENMEIFRRLKEKHPNKFILASIMGQNDEEWQTLARMCQENGADAIELNFSCPNMMEDGLGSDIGEIPELVERYTACARKGASIPILAKLTPNVGSMIPAALAAKKGGADGIAAINTIKSVVGVNPHTYVSAPAVHGKSAVGGYSGNAVKPISLRFTAELSKCEELKDMHISSMGGIETWKDALEFILLGADSIQITTAVMQYGYRIIDDLKSGLNYYLNEKGFKNLKEAKGLGLGSLNATTDQLERDTVIYPKFIHERCIGCKRCYISCMDGGHQAIYFKDDRPYLNGKKCVGCHLCVLICRLNAVVPGIKRVNNNRHFKS